MGIRIVNRANNHTGDNGDEGMFETNALLDEVGIVHAGTGRSLEEARDAATDEAMLVEAAGGAVLIHPAPAENFKVTTRRDLRVAELLLAERGGSVSQ